MAPKDQRSFVPQSAKDRAHSLNRTADRGTLQLAGSNTLGAVKRFSENPDAEIAS